MAARGSQGSELVRGIDSTFPTGSCPVSRMIADAVLRWPREQRRCQIGLGKWQGFLERRQCDRCQATVQYMDSSIPFDKFGPSCP